VYNCVNSVDVIVLYFPLPCFDTVVWSAKRAFYRVLPICANNSFGGILGTRPNLEKRRMRRLFNEDWMCAWCVLWWFCRRFRRCRQTLWTDWCQTVTQLDMSYAVTSFQVNPSKSSGSRTAISIIFS